jgi:hypothetical protein
MYGYYTNHKILGAYIGWQVRTKAAKDDLLSMEELCSMFPKTKFDIIAKSVMSLQLDGYLDYKKKDGSDKIWIAITQKGISAYTGRLFLRKHTECVWKIIIDIFITIANIIVAITAVWAILMTSDQSQDIEKLQEELKMQKQELQQLQEAANPNNPHSGHSDKPNNMPDEKASTNHDTAAFKTNPVDKTTKSK